MSAHAKYLFETVFSNGGDGYAPKYEYTQEDLDGAKQTAFQAGHHKGYQEAQAEASEGLNRRIGELQQQVQALVGQLEAVREELALEAATMALAAARTLVPTLVAQRPEAELIALFKECIGHLRSAPRLVVRVPAENIEELRERCARIAEQSGFDGEVLVLESHDLAMGDCRIEWAEGGVTRDVKSMYQTLTKIVARHAGDVTHSIAAADGVPPAGAEHG